jgi:tetratricopeptide (TPR) repeat protein
VRLQREKRYREAMASYQRAFESSPEHVGALFNYALLLEREHRTAQARQFYDRCVELTKAQSAAKLLHQRLATFASKT